VAERVSHMRSASAGSTKRSSSRALSLAVGNGEDVVDHGLDIELAGHRQRHMSP
jgi:hypothetical protein